MEVNEALGQVVRLLDAGSEQSVLETLVEVAAEVCGAHYSVALVLHPDTTTSAIAHRGMGPVDVARLPHLPRAVGLIGLVLQGEVLRVPDLGSHPQAVGFPGGHVPMRALLAVPILVAGRVLGGMWLTRRPDGPEFTAAEEAGAVAVAAQAGAVVGALRRAEAARDVLTGLRPLEERNSDGRSTMAASGGPAPDVTPASPVLRRLVETTRSMLGMQLAFLSRIDGPTQRFAVVATSPGAPRVTEGSTIELEGGYCHLMLDERITPAVPDLRVHPLTAQMPVTSATGAVSYCGVPVRLTDGTLYGTLCGLDRDPSKTLSGARLQALQTMATMVGERLSEEAVQEADANRRRHEFGPLLTGSHRSVVVQPIVSLQSGDTTGFEVLSRFREPTGAPRRPDEVFAEAGRLGLSRDLEHAAARSALDLLAELPPSTYLSVNLSPRTVLDPATYALFAAYPCDRVVIELTEQEQVEDYPAVLNALAGLRARGARLAIDDTGAGFAGLQHLARLSPDIVKLDISLVRDIDTDRSRRAVARAVTGFAAEVGAALVAEGIETPAELEVLRDLGASHGQGYLLGRPAEPHVHLGRATALLH